MGKSLNDSLMIVQAYNMRGWTQRKKGNGVEALRDFEVGLNIAVKNGYAEEQKFILNNLVLTHTDLSNYDKALEYSFKSLEIRERSGNSLDISIALNNIGVIYSSLDDEENALKYYLKSRDIRVANQIDWDLARCYINIGIAYAELGRLEQALESVLLGTKLIDPSTDREVLVEAFFAKGLIAFQLNEGRKAEADFLKGLELARSIHYKRQEAILTAYLAELEINRGNIQKALLYLRLSTEIAESGFFRGRLLRNLKIHARLFELIGDYKSQAIYQQKYIQLTNEIFKPNLIREISTLVAEREEQENMRIIEAKDQVLSLQEDMLRTNRYFLILSLAVVVVLILLAVVLFKLIKTKQHINRVLERKVAERTAELTGSNRELQVMHQSQRQQLTDTMRQLREFCLTQRGLVGTAKREHPELANSEYFALLEDEVERLNRALGRGERATPPEAGPSVGAVHE